MPCACACRSRRPAQVVSQDGVLLEYDVNTSEGGECRLLQERLLYDSESEELGVHILPQ